MAQLLCNYIWVGPIDQAQDGIATVAIAAPDRAGNAGTGTSTFIFDNTPPTSTIVQPIQDMAYGPTTIMTTIGGGPGNRMRGTAFDALSGIQAPQSVGSFGKLRRIDPDGVETWWDGGAWFAGPGTSYILNADYAVDAFGNVTWEITNGPFGINPWGDGEFTLFVRATDRSGNVQTPDAQVRFYVDTTPPEVDILSMTPSPAKPGTVTITVRAMDVTTGVRQVPTVTVTPNGGAVTTVTSTGCVMTPPTATFPLSGRQSTVCTYDYTVGPTGPDGWAVVNASAIDRAENIGYDDDRFLIDTTPPLLSASATPYYANSGTIVRITVTG